MGRKTGKGQLCCTCPIPAQGQACCQALIGIWGMESLPSQRRWPQEC